MPFTVCEFFVISINVINQELREVLQIIFYFSLFFFAFIDHRFNLKLQDRKEHDRKYKTSQSE